MLPMIMMVIVTSVYSIIDGYFVSNFAGSTAFASMNLIWPVIALMSAIGMMIGAGGSALVSKTLGEGDDVHAREIFTMLIHISTCIGIVCVIVGQIFMRPIAIALGAEGEVIDLASNYGRIVVIAMPAFIIQNEFQSFFMTAERPQLGLWMSIIGGVTNVCLDAILVAVCGWGLIGAAIATAISLTVGGLFPIVFFVSRRNNTHLRFVNHRYEWSSIIKSCSNGMSEYVGNIALCIVSIGYNIQLMKYIGEGGVAAYGIIMYIGFIMAAVFFGYNYGITQIVAFNYGAKNHSELKSLLHKSIVIIGISGIILTVVSELFAPLIASIFVSYDESLMQLSVHAIRVHMLCFLVCGFSIFTSAWFTALNNGMVSAAVAFSRTLIFELGSVIILPAFFGIDGIWMSVNVSEVLALVLSAAVIYAYRKRYCYA